MDMTALYNFYWTMVLIFCENYVANLYYIAYENEHDSTVQIVLGNVININVCQDNGANPLCITFESGYDNTVQIY